MQYQINTLKKSRTFTLKLIENLSIEQLNKIPNGFKNNIAWNITHLVVTQQLLCYKLSGLECLVSKEMILNFQKGSSPSYTVTKEEFEIIKKLFVQLPDEFLSDYSKGKFKNFNAYTTSVQVTLNNVEEAVFFNAYHEGIHLGVVLQLLKFV